MEFVNKIIESTEEIFETMVFLDISSDGDMTEGKEALDCHVSAMIGLSGDFSAMLTVRSSGHIAMEIADSMLGMEFEEVDADVKDVIGEISNMIAGGLKMRFADEGINLELSIPTTVTGKSFCIASPTRSNRVVVPFNLVVGQFFVEINTVSPPRPWTFHRIKRAFWLTSER